MKASKIRTQIADIAVNGRELNEEHLRFVAGGEIIRKNTYAPTFTRFGRRNDVVDAYTIEF